MSIQQQVQLTDVLRPPREEAAADIVVEEEGDVDHRRVVRCAARDELTETKTDDYAQTLYGEPPIMP